MSNNIQCDITESKRERESLVFTNRLFMVYRRVMLMHAMDHVNKYEYVLSDTNRSRKIHNNDHNYYIIVCTTLTL